MLREQKIKKSYDGEECNLMSEFLLPALSVAKSYDRAVGFFSAYALVEAAQGISKLVRNNGKMRLIIGHTLELDEYEAVQKGASLKHIYSGLTDKLIGFLDNPGNGLAKNRLEILSWLTAIGGLEIKFAFRTVGMFHQKIGIITDSANDKIVFQGSANESLNALLPDRNDECISVFKSWEKEIFEGYGQPFLRKFERLWGDYSKGNQVFEVPSDFYDALKKSASKRTDAPNFEIEEELALELQGLMTVKLRPEIPKILGGQEFNLRDHQKAALKEWKKESFQGIFEHATGSGKTITAIYGATKIFLARQKIVLVVAVPYQALADQWVEQLGLFGYRPIRCYISRKNWESELGKAIVNINTSTSDVVCAVVVNATLSTEHFQSQLAKLSPEISNRAAVFIGDECHHHASMSMVSNLPSWNYRLGLSATPFSFNEEANEALESYYGKSISPYSLEDALEQKVLSPYDYHFYETYLTEDETEKYESLSVSIAVQESLKSKRKPYDKDLLLNLYLARGRVVANASGKLPILEKSLMQLGVEKKTLFYCGEGFAEQNESDESLRNIEVLSQLVHKLGWRTSRFTAQETLTQRRAILSSFEQDYVDALVAIRVLDEGIDIPGCRNAYILASSRNPRQFVQRRGRVLRKSLGKEFSRIFDFVVIPCESGSQSLRNLVRSELQRANEFSRLARNSQNTATQIADLADHWGIDHEELEIELRAVEDE